MDGKSAYCIDEIFQNALLAEGKVQWQEVTFGKSKVKSSFLLSCCYLIEQAVTVHGEFHQTC